MPEPEQKRFRSKQDYATPPVFIAAVKAKLEIEAFEYDLAADHTNTQAPQFFCEDMNALAPHWNWAHAIGDGWGWLNPPFTTIAPWAKKCAETVREPGVRKIAFLVPAAVGANWFRDYVWNQHARVLFLNGRLAFMRDKPTWLYPKDCMLVLYGWGFHGCEVWDWRPKKIAKVA